MTDPVTHTDPEGSGGPEVAPLRSDQRQLPEPVAALAEVIAVMDRLRSADGCPWDAEQTHTSLAPYAIEEAYEVAEAAETGDAAQLREELGDLLLQVLFHARIAAESGAFDIAAIAEGLTEKLVRRHPHVFADIHAADAAAVEANWDAIKAAEPGREHFLDGIPAQLPALARAQKLISRATRAGADHPHNIGGDPRSADTSAQAHLGHELLALVTRAHERGIDAEAALRSATRDLETQYRSTSGPA